MRCLSGVWVSCVILGVVAVVTGQMFDKRPTVYDHMKSGANTVKTNLIDTQLKWETQFLPNECTPVDEEDFFGDMGIEIAYKKEKLRHITAEEGDTVTMEFIVSLDADGTVIDTSRRPETDQEQDHAHDDVTDSSNVWGRMKTETEDEDTDDNTADEECTESCREKEEGEHTTEEEDTPLISPPATFTVGYGMIIPGWDMAVKGLCLGEIRKITIPPQLAYGSKGYKPKRIPGDATLVVEVELVYLRKKNFLDHYMDFIYSLPVYAIFILGLTFLLSAYYKSTIAVKRRKYREIMARKEE